MRNAINNNPIAQLAVVGVLLVVTGMLLMMGPMKKDSTEPAAEAAPELGSAEAAPTATAAAATGVATTVPVVPGPPLPRQVTAAQEAGKVVTLLVVRAGGTDDRLLRGAATSLRGVPGLAFFSTRAEGIARYARITQGVDVDRVPALVVVRPPEQAGGVSSAEVRYGFRDAASVVQAVRDVLYQGPAVGYSPE